MRRYVGAIHKQSNAKLEMKQAPPRKAVFCSSFSGAVVILHLLRG
jgi:hypothetical protein